MAPKGVMGMRKLMAALLALAMIFAAAGAMAARDSFEYKRPAEVRILWNKLSHFDKAVDFRFYALPDGRWLLIGRVQYANTRDKYVMMTEADAIICGPELIESGKLGRMNSHEWAMYASELPQYRDSEVLPGSATFVQAVELYSDGVIFEPGEKKILYYEDVIACEDPEKINVYLYDSGHLNLPMNE